MQGGGRVVEENKRETEKPKVLGWSAKRRFRIVDLPEPEGPEMTIGRYLCGFSIGSFCVGACVDQHWAEWGRGELLFTCGDHSEVFSGAFAARVSKMWP